MTRHPYLRPLGLIILAAASFTALAQQDRPTPEQMEVIHACMEEAGIERPEPTLIEGEGGKPKKMQLTDEQRAVADACFEANGFEPPRKMKIKNETKN